MTPPPAARRRVRARVEGTVQGVGFRPYVYRLATGLGLAGFVGNDARGVVLEVEGPASAVEGFLQRLPAEAPSLASVERVVSESLDLAGVSGFEIADSESAGELDAAVTPDSATCAECLREVFDPGDRRHRYPFTNCTDCGPRFTIVRGIPYDRPQTTMAGFEMCERCRAEYEDPGDRRFHAQPNACPDCGPRVRLATPDGEGLSPGEAPGARDPIAAAARELAAGRILAVKGIGGFHLACRADDEAAVAKLRSRKHREERPFALMAPGLDAAAELIALRDEDCELIAGPERPIVVGPRRDRRSDGGPVAASVAPRSADLGVMLPYSPLHHLLLADLAEATGEPTSLVMTSGNLSEEPIAFDDGDALGRLGGIADLFLLGDRPIATRTDDSVVRALDPGTGKPLMLRRSRGYVPAAVTLPGEAPPLLACGAELKNTFCVAKGRRAWVSHHVGDLENYETLRSFEAGIEHFQRLFAVAPELVVHDLHPEYLSTKYALERPDVRKLGVQHHHAHLAACLGEHAEPGPAVGAIFDGTGYGPDGTVWGGELLVGSPGSYRRAGMLWPVRLPGGAAAIREPWRMACSWLAAAAGEAKPPIPAAFAGDVDGERWEEVCELVRTGVASPPTTSVGRLFDAVAAICGLPPRVSYEGQAAAELEAAADPTESGAYALPIVDAGAERDAVGEAGGPGAGGIERRDVEQGLVLLDARELVRAVAADAEAGVGVATISARFHNALATVTARACAEEAERSGLAVAALAGGVFQNRLLLGRTSDLLADRVDRVLVPRRLPPNDGAISYGQAVVAAAGETS